MDNNNLYGGDDSGSNGANPYENGGQSGETQGNQYQQPSDQSNQYQPNYQQPADQNGQYQDPYQQPYQTTPQYQQNTYYQQGGAVQQPDKASGMAIASMVCGILSILCCCAWYISVILSIVAIILGIVNNSKKMGGKGMAIAGIITGSVGILCVVIFLILIVLGMASSDITSYMNY